MYSGRLGWNVNAPAPTASATIAASFLMDEKSGALRSRRGGRSMSEPTETVSKAARHRTARMGPMANGTSMKDH
jgi:hypothetical protein